MKEQPKAVGYCTEETRKMLVDNRKAYIAVNQEIERMSEKLDFLQEEARTLWQLAAAEALPAMRQGSFGLILDTGALYELDGDDR